MFAGIFTLTEAGAVGALLSLLLAATRRALTWPVLKRSLLLTLAGTAGIFMVVIGTVLLGKFMALSTVPAVITQWFMGLGASQLVVVIAISEIGRAHV